MKIEEVIKEGKSIEAKITALKEKSIQVEFWNKLVKEYDPTRHEIMRDQVTRKDKIRKDGVEKAARVTYGQQKMFARRMTQMAFAIPVKREYDIKDDAESKEIATAIEKIYKRSRIDAVNVNRMHAYFAACEICTIWYAVRAENEDYGFRSDFKLRSMSYSPMHNKFSRIEQANLYPLFDNGDMIAMSFEYTKKEDNRDVDYFETYTANKRYIWKRDNSGWQNALTKPDDIVILKIPCSYLWRPMPIWEDTTNNTKEIEYTLSRQSDILRRNSAPILAVEGEITPKDSSEDVAREVYKVKDGGSVNYVTWQQQIEAMKFYTGELKRNTEEELQLPNLSLENVKGLGAMSGEARKTLLTDAHLKVGYESGEIIEFLDRECNVIKAFLEVMNTKWKGKTSKVGVEHIITPFIQNDEMNEIEKIMKVTGGEAVASRETGVRLLGWVSEDKIREECQKIEEEQASKLAPSVFEPTE
jgi:hypothetical protein